LLLGQPDAKLGVGRGLADIAPTVLDLLDIPKPKEMTGTSLRLKKF
jgi:2,3-bisphosphoglycerate-independent phosphoglycerate mutase